MAFRGDCDLKISSEHIANLLAYAKERHGAPCRVEFREIQSLDWDENGEFFWNAWDFASCKIYFRDGHKDWPVEEILI